MMLLLLHVALVTNFRGKKVYEPPRFMSVGTAIEQLLEVEQKRGESGRFFLHLGVLLC